MAPWRDWTPEQGPEQHVGVQQQLHALQLVVGKRLEEGVIDAALQKPELAARAGIEGHLLGDRLVVASQHDGLPSGPGQQGREVGHGLLHVYEARRGGWWTGAGKAVGRGHWLVWSFWSD